MAKNVKQELWFSKYWRPLAAIVYLVICIFDFILVPIWVGIHNEKLGEIVEAVKDLPPNVQIVILNHRLDQWSPLTLGGGGLFHVAFGAIVGVTAWSRGREKISAMTNRVRYTEEPIDDGFQNMNRPQVDSPEGD